MSRIASHFLLEHSQVGWRQGGSFGSSSNSTLLGAIEMLSPDFLKEKHIPKTKSWKSSMNQSKKSYNNHKTLEIFRDFAMFLQFFFFIFHFSFIFFKFLHFSTFFLHFSSFFIIFIDFQRFSATS